MPWNGVALSGGSGGRGAPLSRAGRSSAIPSRGTRIRRGGQTLWTRAGSGGCRRPANGEHDGVLDGLPPVLDPRAPDRIVAGTAEGDGLGREVELEAALDKQAKSRGGLVRIPIGANVTRRVDTPLDFYVGRRPRV